jgi:hypothetical protein
VAHQGGWRGRGGGVPAGGQQAGGGGFDVGEFARAGGAQQAGAHVGDLRGDEDAGQVKGVGVLGGQAVLCVAQFDVGARGAGEAAEVFAVLLREDQVDAVFQGASQEGARERDGCGAHDLPDAVIRHGQQLRVAVQDAQALPIGTQAGAGFGDVEGRLQRRGTFLGTRAGACGGGLAEEVHAFVEALDVRLGLVQLQIESAQGLGGEVEGLLALVEAGDGDREVVAVAKDAVTGVEQVAVEGVKVEVREHRGERTAFGAGPARDGYDPPPVPQRVG